MRWGFLWEGGCRRQELFVGYLLFEVTQQFREMPKKDMNNFPTNNK
jgi:hypothetical protein